MSALFVIRQRHFCHCQKLQRCARRVFLDEGLDFKLTEIIECRSEPGMRPIPPSEGLKVVRDFL